MEIKRQKGHLKVHLALILNRPFCRLNRFYFPISLRGRMLLRGVEPETSLVLETVDCPRQQKKKKTRTAERASESEIRENRYISPWSIMARLLFALGPWVALHSTYTSLLISQTPAVCQLILTFSKSITPLSKVSVPANLYCAHTHILSHTLYYILAHQRKKIRR